MSRRDAPMTQGRCTMGTPCGAHVAYRRVMKSGFVGLGRMGSAAALLQGVDRFEWRVSDSGEERFASRGQQYFDNKVLPALRLQFGGHVEKRP